MNIVEVAVSAASPAPVPASGRPAPRPEPPAAAAEAQAPPAQRREHLRQAVSQANARAAALKRDLQFSVDDSTGETVIRVIDTQTKEVIRQIPPDEMLALARALLQMSGPALLDAQA